jgi:hypothetical protein
LIYLDSSVALAQLLGEDTRPPPRLWEEDLVSSRLLEYEVWTRANALGRRAEVEDAVHELLSEVDLIELAPPVLSRALEPFPVRVRTLDALHLATLDFLRRQKQTVVLATYDRHMGAAARSLDFPLFALEVPRS